MASKFLHSFTNDENPDLQRQIGCMTGIFQIFDRHHVLTARHINPKKLQHQHQQQQQHQYGSHFSHGTIHEADKGKISNDNNKQRVVVVSMESSQASFSSSSRSSSFSSIDYSRTAQPETAFSFDRVIFPDTPSSRIITPTTTASSPQFSNHHLRDVVELSDWSSSSKSTWNLDENGDVPRKSSTTATTTNIFAFPKDCPARASSYDLGENFKSTAPRLSLDSREGSLRSFKDSKPRLLRNSKSQRESSSSDLVSSLQQSSTIQKRLPSVVAKLMGLEALPAASETQTMPSMKTSVSVSVVVDEETMKSSKLTSQGRSRREPTSPRRRNNDVVVMKPITTSRFPIEPAPWKQIDGGRRTQRSKTTIRSVDTFPSVYGEIEKRMKDIEFTQAGKDLRALKQILEAMQTKGLLGTEIEDDLKPALKSRQVVNRSNSESPIVIMKPAKPVEKSIDRTKEQIQKTPKTNVKTSNPLQTSSRRSSSKDDEKSNSVKTSSPSISPRLHQKKLDLQKKSRPPTPPDSNKSRRQHHEPPSPPPVESIGSPGGKRRPNKHLGKLKKEPDSGTETFRPAKNLNLEELRSITPDQQPSPVSVLDNSPYDNHDEDSTTINRKKLENIELLVKKLKQLNSEHNEAQTDYIASLCENKNPDHRYISEILLASGLILRDLSSSSSLNSIDGFPINPDLYLVLEQTRASNCNNNSYNTKGSNEKMHRKFVFDSVNEILSMKLSSFGHHLRRVKMVRSCLNGQKLLKELCCEIDKMQQQQIEANNKKKMMNQDGDEDKDEDKDSLKCILWEDVIDGTEQWTEFSNEIPEAVLDIERMVFKDLVDEIVRGEEESVAGRFRRKLFVD